MADLAHRPTTVEHGRLHEQMRLAITAARLNFWDWDLLSGEIEWSEGLEAACGLPPGGFGRTVESFRALIPEDELSRVDAALSRAIAGDAEFDLEFRMNRADGGQRWVLARATVLRDADGRAVRIIGVDLDITGRRSNELALERSNATLRRVAETAGVATFEVANPGSGGEAVVSPGFHALWGLPEDAPLTLETTIGCLHPEDRARILADHRRLAREAGRYEADFRVVHPGRDIRWLHIIGEREPGANGMPAGMHGIILDITERKRAEEALRRSEGRYRTLIESGPYMAWIMRPDRTLSFTNRHWRDFVGSDGDKMGPREWLAFIHPDDRARVDQDIAAAFASGQPTEIRMRARRRDGAWRWIVRNTAPVRDADGQIIEWVGFSLDVHEKHELEERGRELLELAERSPDLIAISDLRGKLTYLNRGGRLMIGADLTAPAETISYDQYLTPASRRLLKDEAIPTARATGAWEGEMQLVHQKTRTHRRTAYRLLGARCRGPAHRLCRHLAGHHESQ